MISSCVCHPVCLLTLRTTRWTRKRIYVFNILHLSRRLSRSRGGRHADMYTHPPQGIDVVVRNHFRTYCISNMVDHWCVRTVSQLLRNTFERRSCVHIQLIVGVSSDSRLFLSPPLTSFEGYTKKSRWPGSSSLASVRPPVHPNDV